LVETRKRFKEAEQSIMRLLAEPLSRKISEQLRVTLAALPKQASSLMEQTVPRIDLENQMTFEKSIASLCAWIRLTRNLVPGASQLLANMVELRVLAEEGNAAEALENGFFRDLLGVIDWLKTHIALAGSSCRLWPKATRRPWARLFARAGRVRYAWRPAATPTVVRETVAAAHQPTRIYGAIPSFC
jgi:hypothetical protein